MAPSKAEVWMVDLKGRSGHEQKGERPGVLWRDLDHVGLAIVIPITSSPARENMPHTHPIFPSPKNGLDKESTVMVFQMSCMDKTRLKKRIGGLEAEDISGISTIMRDMLRI